jgi:hypothetical protein
MTVSMRSIVARRDVAISARMAVIAVTALMLMLVIVAPAWALNTITPGSFTASPTTLQAGAHPDLTTTFSLETDAEGAPLGGPPKDGNIALPVGLVGAADATPTCPMSTVVTYGALCPLDTAVGEVTVEVTLPGTGSRLRLKRLVFNVTPYPGEPAAFGFDALYPVRIGTKVRSDGDYGITASATDLTEAATVVSFALTLWGVPADHDGPGPFIDQGDFFTGRTYGGQGNEPRVAFLTNPTQCSGAPLTSLLAVDSWLTPGFFDEATSDAGSITGCDLLSFAPSLDLRPESQVAGAPSGVVVDLTVPQNPDPGGLATAQVKDVSVALPAGMTLSPSLAGGLEACSDEQFGLHELGAASCPEGSKIGTAELTTPLLDGPLTGEVILGTQQSQDPQSGQMYRLFLQLAGSGVRVKLAGSVKVDPVTGQITATFASNPRLPFGDLKLSFDGGSRAPLVTPSACGTYTAHGEITSWASDVPVQSNPSFTIDSNCNAASQFTPSLKAGVASPVAGASSPFSLTLARPDGQQDLSSLDVALPPGLLANVGSVPLCADAQAAAGTCSSASQIGHVAVAAGAGSTPLYVPQPGKAPTAVYLGGPYKGAPFSLSIVVPAQAGPFDLGTVVVRAALFVDKHDAHASVKSDPIPTIVDGVPLRLQKINVTVDRPGFMLAPSSCKQMQVTGTASSSGGLTAALASRFQVGSCASLKFAPKLSAVVSGVVSHKRGTTTVLASKPNGIKLHVKLAYPSGPLGSQANIAKVKVELPKQLPSRLSTLQKSCTAAQFTANPAGCPAESIVGSATATTPLLPVPLTGPAYFVSHGGEAFPSLTMVLQGYGVTVELVGTTLIRKGITSTTFKEVPDVPVSSFELTLPQGKFSALTANGDLCNPSVTKMVKKKVRVQVNGRMRTVLRKVKQPVSTSLKIPTEYIAQNGATLHANTPVAVEDCAKAKSATAAKARKKAKGEKR